MRKLQMIMIGVFCTGVFLSGAGTGLAFSEVSSFAYMGEKDAGTVDMQTEEFECAFEPREEKLAGYNHYGSHSGQEELVESPDVPENTIRFQVTYNAAAVKPFLDYAENESAGIYYSYIGDSSDDFKIFMECKDQILADLKDRKISTYRTQTIKEIKILVNPSSVDSIRFVR